jgi:nicotinate-nucleotide--dimethylbenzimidazole phosphoribosyltransferase
MTTPLPAFSQAPGTSVNSALDEIRQLVQNDLSPLPAMAASQRLGDFTSAWLWLASAQNKDRPEIRHPRVALFMAAHGAFLERQAEITSIVAGLKDGTHAVSPLVRAADADLQVYELDLDLPSRDFRAGRALDNNGCAQAIAYGMMAVQPGVDLLLLSSLNPVAELAAAEIARALEAKVDAFDALLRFGGFDIAAMAGAIIAARLAKIPVLLDGAGAQAAAAVLEALKPGAAAHARSSTAIISEATAMPAPCSGVFLIPLLKTIAQAA